MVAPFFPKLFQASSSYSHSFGAFHHVFLSSLVFFYFIGVAFHHGVHVFCLFVLPKVNKVPKINEGQACTLLALENLPLPCHALLFIYAFFSSCPTHDKKLL